MMSTASSRLGRERLLKEAYATQGYPCSVSRDEIRRDQNHGLVLECKRKPLTDLTNSPPPTCTFVAFGLCGKQTSPSECGKQTSPSEVAALEFKIAALETKESASEMKIAALEMRIATLEEMLARQRLDLYGPLLTTREQAACSLLKLNARVLDDCVRQTIQEKAEQKQKNERRAFYHLFDECKGDQKQYMYKRLEQKAYHAKGENKKVFLATLEAAEALYISRSGDETLQAEELRRGMRKWYSLKKARDEGAHAFDAFDADVLQDEEKTAVIEDIRNAIGKGWLKRREFAEPVLLRVLRCACDMEEARILS